MRLFPKMSMIRVTHGLLNRYERSNHQKQSGTVVVMRDNVHHKCSKQAARNPVIQRTNCDQTLPYRDFMKSERRTATGPPSQLHVGRRTLVIRKMVKTATSSRSRQNLTYVLSADGPGICDVGFTNVIDIDRLSQFLDRLNPAKQGE